jgi:hypothetical protein
MNEKEEKNSIEGEFKAEASIDVGGGSSKKSNKHATLKNRIKNRLTIKVGKLELTSSRIDNSEQTNRKSEEGTTNWRFDFRFSILLTVMLVGALVATAPKLRNQVLDWLGLRESGGNVTRKYSLVPNLPDGVKSNLRATLEELNVNELDRDAWIGEASKDVFDASSIILDMAQPDDRFTKAVGLLRNGRFDAPIAALTNYVHTTRQYGSGESLSLPAFAASLLYRAQFNYPHAILNALNALTFKNDDYRYHLAVGKSERKIHELFGSNTLSRALHHLKIAEELAEARLGKEHPYMMEVYSERYRIHKIAGQSREAEQYESKQADTAYSFTTIERAIKDKGPIASTMSGVFRFMTENEPYNHWKVDAKARDQVDLFREIHGLYALYGEKKRDQQGSKDRSPERNAVAASVLPLALIESGSTIGSGSYDVSLSGEYLQQIFDGDLLESITSALEAGRAEDQPGYYKGDVSAFIITYVNDSSMVSNVAVCLIGEAPYREIVTMASINETSSSHRFMTAIVNGEYDTISREIGLHGTQHFIANFPSLEILVRGRVDATNANVEIIAASNNKYEVDRIYYHASEILDMAERIAATYGQELVNGGTASQPYWVYEIMSLANRAFLSRISGLVRVELEVNRRVLDVILRSYVRIYSDVIRQADVMSQVTPR